MVDRPIFFKALYSRGRGNTVTEVKKESLSALLDGEASEIEVHRLVREFRDDDSLTTSWATYQQIRTQIRRTARSESQLEPAHHSALFERISSAIEAEDPHTDTGATLGVAAGKRANLRRNSAVAGSLALAACLVIAVFIGVQTGTDPAQPGLAGGSVEVNTNAVAGTQLVSTGSQGPEATQELVMPELIELDEEKQRRLRAYLNQHDRMSRMDTPQQFVNHPNSPK